MRYEWLVLVWGIGWMGCSSAPTQVPAMPCPPDQPGAIILNDHCFGEAADKAVYVDGASGADTNEGDPLTPMRTITAGIAKAQVLGKSQVHIAGGTYVESVSLQSGISLDGGYSRENAWKKDPSLYPTSIIGIPTDQGAVGLSAANIVQETILSDMSILAPDATAFGTSAYGLRCIHCEALRLLRVTVEAGRGAPGKPGVDGAAGLNASQFPEGNGKNGALDPDRGFAICYQGDSPAPGGAGGLVSGGNAGGTGGFGGFQSNSIALPDGQAGAGGMGSGRIGFGSGGLGGAGYTSTSTLGVFGQSGDPGLRGDDGQPGFGGDGGNFLGSFLNVLTGDFSPDRGLRGDTGFPGQGGGGGGGSGRLRLVSAFGTTVRFYQGYGGGGGGGGGLGGLGGNGGQGGGGSFGILAIFSEGMVVEDSTIRSGSGGDGGQGGAGGAGGAGGKGGKGGDVSTSACMAALGRGGEGGMGGTGGPGGGGGGGPGGPSFAIYQRLGSITLQGQTQLSRSTGGQPGAGGYSSFYPGKPGVVGPSMDVFSQ